MTRTLIDTLLLTGLLAALLAAFPGRAMAASPAPDPTGPGCAPTVARALEAAASDGAQRDIAYIRSEATGISQPGPLADFSCLDRFLTFNRLDVHVDTSRLLAGLLGNIRGRVCNAATRLHAELSGEPLPALYGSAAPRLPALAPVSGR